MAVDDWPPPEGFADRLARLRRVLGVENQAIAAAVGVGTETVSKWVGGQEPKADKLLALAEYFGVSPGYLLRGTPGPAKRPVIVKAPKFKQRQRGKPQPHQTKKPERGSGS